MQITVMKSKLAYVRVTDASLFYEGSILIDSEWMQQANIAENEQVLVVNVNNGERLTTYAIKGTPGSKAIQLNGPAARKGLVGDLFVIITFAAIEPSRETLIPTVVNIEDPHALSSH